MQLSLLFSLVKDYHWNWLAHHPVNPLTHHKIENWTRNMLFTSKQHTFPKEKQLEVFAGLMRQHYQRGICVGAGLYKNYFLTLTLDFALMVHNWNQIFIAFSLRNLLTFPDCRSHSHGFCELMQSKEFFKIVNLRAYSLSFTASSDLPVKKVKISFYLWNNII